MLEPREGQKGRVVLLTSVLPEEGKSTLTLSLGRLAAAKGMRVLALDVDRPPPSLHRLAGLPPGPGVIELLGGDTAARGRDPHRPAHGPAHPRQLRPAQPADPPPDRRPPRP